MPLPTRASDMTGSSSSTSLSNAATSSSLPTFSSHGTRTSTPSFTDGCLGSRTVCSRILRLTLRRCWAISKRFTTLLTRNNWGVERIGVDRMRITIPFQCSDRVSLLTLCMSRESDRVPWLTLCMPRRKLYMTRTSQCQTEGGRPPFKHDSSVILSA